MFNSKVVAVAFVLELLTIPISNSPNKKEFKYYASLLQGIQDLSEDEFEEEDVDSSHSILIQYEDDYIDREFIESSNYHSHKSALKSYYLMQNQEFISSLPDLNYDFIVSFDYGPFIQLNYSPENDLIDKDLQYLEKLGVYVANQDIVTSYEEYQSGNTQNSPDYSETYQYSDILRDLGLEEKYTGKGIKIGSIEKGTPSYKEHLENTICHYNGKSNEEEEHCSMTSAIYGGDSGIAPDAELYFASVPYSSYLIEKMTWLIDNDVDIINQSATFQNSGKYDTYSAYVDYISYNFGITYVVSSGNADVGTHKINSTSMGANVISVGASCADYGVRYKSCYLKSNSAFTKAKPNLIAPGDHIKNIPYQDKIYYTGYLASGTSASAPFVTGIVALLMEEFPDLVKKPEKVISLLQASATKAKNQTSVYDNYAGFGMVNYKNAREAHQNINSFIANNSYTAGSSIYSSDAISLEKGETITINALLLEPSTQTDLHASSSNPDYATIQVVVVNSNLGRFKTNGIVLGNTSYLEISTDSSAVSSKNIKIYIIANKNLADGEDLRCSLSYRITSNN